MRVVIVILAMFGHFCLAKLSQNEIAIERMFHNLKAFAEFKYGRHFKIEQLTCEVIRAGQNGYEDINTNQILKDNLRMLLDRYYTRYELIKNSLRHTEGKLCVAGLAEHFDKLSIEEIGGIDVCIDNALSQQKKFEDKLSKVITNFEEDNHRVHEGLIVCLEKFDKPTPYAKEAFKDCHKIEYDRFVKKYDKELETYLDSPCMNNFVSSLLPCFLNRIKTIKETADKLIKKLDYCISIGDLDIPNITVGLESIDIIPRIKSLQQDYKNLNEVVRKKLREYYDEYNKFMEDQLHLSVKSPNNKVDVLSNYFKTINQTIRDHKSNREHLRCATAAEDELQGLVKHELELAEFCRNSTFSVLGGRVENVRRELSAAIGGLEGASNVAILECLATVYVFGNGTIEQCCDLKKREFQLTWEATLKKADLLEKLSKEPKVEECMKTGSKQLQLQADRALFYCSVCLSKAHDSKSGPVNYQVTIPPKDTHHS